MEFRVHLILCVCVWRSVSWHALFGAHNSSRASPVLCEPLFSLNNTNFTLIWSRKCQQLSSSGGIDLFLQCTMRVVFFLSLSYCGDELWRIAWKLIEQSRACDVERIDEMYIYFANLLFSLYFFNLYFQTIVFSKCDTTYRVGSEGRVQMCFEAYNMKWIHT